MTSSNQKLASKRWVCNYNRVADGDKPQFIIYINDIEKTILIYLKKQTKPKEYIKFNSQEKMESYIENCINTLKARYEQKVKDRADRKIKLAELAKTVVVGDILHCSWGYEQTQCEFFQIVSKKGQTVEVREIAGESSNEGNMCCCLKPIKDQFLKDSPIIKKQLRGNSITLDSVRSATKCDPTQTYYCSWYY